jgi:hypothetical protein
LEATGWSFSGISTTERAFLDLHIRMQILMRRLDRLMSKSQGDHREVDPMLQQRHGCRMSQRMGRDPTLA